MSGATEEIKTEIERLEREMGWGRDAPSHLDLIMSLIRLVKRQNEAIEMLEFEVRELRRKGDEVSDGE